MKPVTKAILPVAGMGTRFLPATKAQPKEMLPIFDTPAIQFIVEEAVNAGITDIIIVTGRNKRAIEDHFDTNFELEYALKERGKEKELKLVQDISNLANIAYVRQNQPLGDGHAILCADHLIEDDEPVVVLFGDDIVDNPGGPNAVQQLLEVYEETKNSVVLLEEIDMKESYKYGIVGFDQIMEKTVNIKAYVEKPAPSLAPSNLGVVGKYIITPEIMAHLRETKIGNDGEIRLANAFAKVLSNGGHISGRILEGVRFDTGDKLGFLKATLHFALQTENYSAAKALQAFLQSER